jgi:hypothetical protein
MIGFQALLNPKYVSDDCHKYVGGVVAGAEAGLVLDSKSRPVVHHLLYIAVSNKVLYDDSPDVAKSTYEIGDVIRKLMPDVSITMVMKDKSVHCVKTSSLFKPSSTESITISMPQLFASDFENGLAMSCEISKCSSFNDAVNVSLLEKIIHELSCESDITRNWYLHFKAVYANKSKDNNAELYCVIFPSFGVPVFFVTASRCIGAGEEINVTYGAEHWAMLLLRTIKGPEYEEALKHIIL